MSASMLRILAFVALALFASRDPRAFAEASSVDQSAAGLRLAEMVCGPCHAVTLRRDELPVLNPPATSFADLAQRPSLTDKSLREFLGSNHRGLGPAEAMPNPRLMDYQIDEIVAYFATLKAKR
ncbi:MAG TPA: c-type cytochrome [Xanthobacteraceae bacterium]|nr:c-type cytochrome [Xanthobacteraceae bacterium]